jgi:uncharacterized membrane protein YczE
MKEQESAAKQKIHLSFSNVIVVYRELLLLAAIALGSAGITLMVRSGLGISVASAVPYVFCLHFTLFTFGTWSFISYVFVIIFTVVLTRHFEKSYLVSFVVAFFYGMSNDLFKYIWSFLPSSQVLKILYYLFGWLFLSAGIASFIKSGLPPAPYELFVREVSRFKGFSVSKVKTAFDLSSLVVSVLFITLVLRRFVGIGIGTVIAGLFNGSVVGHWLHLMDRHFKMESLIPVRKK